MHQFRTHTCASLTIKDVGKIARLSGWINRKRDHGNLLFIDLRDQFGITQCVIDTSSDIFKIIDDARPETVMCVITTVCASM